MCYDIKVKRGEETHQNILLRTIFSRLNAGSRINAGSQQTRTQSLLMMRKREEETRED